MKQPFATGPDRLAYYRQQGAIALQQAKECNTQEDREVWVNIAEEWQRLHDALARDLADPTDPTDPPLHPGAGNGI